MIWSWNKLYQLDWSQNLIWVLNPIKWGCVFWKMFFIFDLKNDHNILVCECFLLFLPLLHLKSLQDSFWSKENILQKYSYYNRPMLCCKRIISLIKKFNFFERQKNEPKIVRNESFDYLLLKIFSKICKNSTFYEILIILSIILKYLWNLINVPKMNLFASCCKKTSFLAEGV